MPNALTLRGDPPGEAKSRLLKLGVLGVAVVIFLWQGPALMKNTPPPVDDFIEYWAASRLLLLGKNPYSTEQLLSIQRPLSGAESPLIMWNPPWTLSLLLPFGFFNYATSRWLWFFLNLALLLFSARWLWSAYAKHHGQPLVALAVALTFLSGPVVLGLGQISPLMLAGIIGFLSSIQRQRYGMAGAATPLIALKPHLLWLFWVALFLWVLQERKWAVLSGASLSIVLAAGFPWFWNSELYSGYIHLVVNESIFHHPSTTIGAFLRSMLGWERLWLQFVPLGFGLAWIVAYWRAHRQGWNWTRETPLLLLVSVVTTCYGWVFDQVVLYPAVFQAVAWLIQTGRPSYYLLAGALYVALNAAGLLLIILGWNGIGYVWMAPAWLVFHWVLKRKWTRAEVAREKHLLKV